MNIENLTKNTSAIEESLKSIVALKSVVLDEPSVASELPSHHKLEDFLKAPRNDQKEILLKKAFAVALAIAKEKGVLEAIPDTPLELASLVDDGLTRVKNSYLVGAGILTPEAAIENYIDRTAARCITAVNMAFESGAVNMAVTDGLVKAAYIIPVIGPAIGPVAEVYRPIISAFISHVEKPMRTIIIKGVNEVTTHAKQIVHKTIETVKNTVSTIAQRFFSIA